MSYSPKIDPELVRQLYILKHSNPQKTPMTKMVNEAVADYLQRNKMKGENGNETTYKAVS